MSITAGQPSSTEVSDPAEAIEQPSPVRSEQQEVPGKRSRGLRAFLGRALATEPVQGTLLASSFLILKVLLVAKGDILAALAVLQNSGTVTVIIGAVLSALPVIGAVIVVVMLYGLGCGVWGWRSLGDPLAVLGSFIALTAWILLTPWPVFALTFGGLLGGLLDRGLRNRKARRGEEISLARIRLVPVVLVCVLALLPVGKDIAYAMWLPREELRLEPSEESSTQQQEAQIVVGYVLGEGEGWTSILTSGDRTVQRFKSDDVASRHVCRNKKNYRESVAEYIRRKWFNYINDVPFCHTGG